MATDYLVTVCAECLRASCWHGDYMCEKSKHSDITRRKASELDALAREHPSHYSRERLLRICGHIDEVMSDG